MAFGGLKGEEGEELILESTQPAKGCNLLDFLVEVYLLACRGSFFSCWY